jgi:hypothetical protein
MLAKDFEMNFSVMSVPIFAVFDVKYINITFYIFYIFN